MHDISLIEMYKKRTHNKLWFNIGHIFLFISLIIRKLFHFMLSDQLEKLFSVLCQYPHKYLSMSKNVLKTLEYIKFILT